MIRPVNVAMLEIMEQFKSLNSTDDNPDQTSEEFTKELEDYSLRSMFLRENKRFANEIIALTLLYSKLPLTEKIIAEQTVVETDITH